MAQNTVFAQEDGEIHGRMVEQDGKDVMVREQYVGHIREYCIARHNEGHHGPSKDMRLMASLPKVVIEHYCNLNQISFRECMKNPEHIKRMVNDPALSDFRIAPGRM